MAVPPQLKAFAFKPGQSGCPGGRRIKNQVREGLKRFSKDPVAEILLLLPELKPDKQVDVWLSLLSYIQGKPKDVDMAPSNEELLELLDERFPKDEAG